MAEDQSTTEIDLFAFILGDSPPSDHSFPVTASAGKSVGQLKKLVHIEKQNQLKGIDADKLVLWKLKDPILGDEPEATAGVTALGPNGQKLSELAVKMVPTKKLEFYFPSAPEEESIHIIVQAPSLPSAGQKRGLSDDDVDVRTHPFKRIHAEREEAFKIVQSKLSPSSAITSAGLTQTQAKDPFLNGRPFEAVGPPITIYEPIFSKFRAMNEGKLSVDISPEDYGFAEDFLVASAKIYTSEKERQTAITKPLARLLGMAFIQVTLNDTTSNDGAIQVLFGQIVCLLLMMELKNEGGKGDPSVQVGCSYTRWWADGLGAHFRERTCCPSFLLSIAGPWICVQGGILSGKAWTMQPLTEALWTGGTTDMDGRGRQIARLFCSLRAALKSLEGRFMAVKDTPPPSIPPVFPFITSFVDLANHTEETLAYEDRHHFERGRDGTAIFSASLNNGDAVFVKFVTRYNAPAHQLLAGEGLAPQLRYCAELAPGETHFMVVMDRIVGSNMYNKPFQEEDLTRVQQAKNLLHKNGFVFGDLRPANIVKPMDGTGVVLVDFDWCGRDGVDTYPLFVNKLACNWHADVRGGAIMRKAHDDHLFDQLGR